MSSMTELKSRVESTSSTPPIPRQLPHVPSRLWQAAIYGPLGHILQAEGKRLRAELIELSYQIAGGKGQVPNALIDFIELLHAGSLVIDDIEDGSSSRRGQPTLHQVVGTPLAINTGSWMYFSALEKLQDLPLDSARLAPMMAEAISTIRRCHEGQALDLAAKVVDLDRLHVYATAKTISRLKTGGVTAMAAKFAAALAGASEQSQAAFHSFGMQLGVGLQMQNDLSELKSSSEFGGRVDDLRNARVTWPWAWFSRLRSETPFAELQCRLRDSDQANFHEVASILLEAVETVCKKSIYQKIDGALSCLKNQPQQNSSAIDRFLERIEGYYV